ncbi:MULTISPECIES: helix-turn-helix domain-containing protein [unclassified Sedimentibacter]|uniref:helix-turn-helix domain-containing protein n=1 Tax=unclassified Sedimentibacter TaxID=2649220 RepID=UPI0027E171AA|nr:helix-turn-helix domain-containing protein [Sedimentibacter sp. MB35-C1]WMJ77290.1 helix-turn-helix domain-containing protein [Sedimentibacter sp. MB35-C1]
MLKEKTFLIAVICLSISIIISSFIIYKGMELNGIYVSNGMHDISQKLESVNDAAYYNKSNNDIMDINTAAEYLGLDTNDLLKVINAKGIDFPYVKVGSNFIINKIALDKWMENARIEIQ